MFCVRSSTWRRPRRPLPVRSAAAALELVALAMSRPARAETIAFDPRRRRLRQHRAPRRRHRAARRAARRRPDRRRRGPGRRRRGIVVASVRPVALGADEAAAVADGDIDRWFAASDIAADHGVELLEWFVVGPFGVICPRELLGERPRWPLRGRSTVRARRRRRAGTAGRRGGRTAPASRRGSRRSGSCRSARPSTCPRTPGR